MYVKEFDMSKALFKKKKLKTHSQLKTAYTQCKSEQQPVARKGTLIQLKQQIQFFLELIQNLPRNCKKIGEVKKKIRKIKTVQVPMCLFF